MFDNAISKNTQKNLELLSQLEEINQFYLAGGTAAAFHFGHRISLDLDFFTRADFDNEKLTAELSELGKLSVDQTRKNTFLGSLNRVKISFFKYPYPLLEETQKYKGIKIAGLADIGAMKIEAISGRGTKRDFIDLYILCQRFQPLEDILRLFDKKYAGVDFSWIHIMKSLSYFEDAEADEVPRLLEPIDWKKVKKFFLVETKKIVFNSFRQADLFNFKKR